MYLFSDSAGDDTMVICMDLMQAMPTPKVSTSIAFYLRKLWTFNFGIHDMKTGRGYMYVWDETTARRGAIEICSCIYKFVTTVVPPTVKKLVIFSDNCPGQNKNFFIVLFYLFLIHSRHFEEIVHIFLRVGHTYNRSDQDFSLIEKQQKKVNSVFTLDGHIDIIKKSKIQKPFMVTKMDQGSFLNFEDLKKLCIKRASPTGVSFSDACYFKVSKDFKEGYELANDYASLELGTGHQVRVAPLDSRALIPFNLNISISPKYTGPLPLTEAKLKDLRTLMQLVPQYDQERYWNAILSQTSAHSTDVADEDDGDDPGQFGDMFDY